MEILRAIVEDYVHTREPVGSKAIAERHDLGVSSATIRNDMALLEEEGLLTAPHTSAGRIPTVKGYRAFVDQIAHIKPLSTPERRAIEHFLERSDDVDDLMARTVRLLAQLTNQVAIFQYPHRTLLALKHIEFVLVSPERVLMVLISTNGVVDQRLITLEGATSESELSALKLLLLEELAGESVDNLGSILDRLRAESRKPTAAEGDYSETLESAVFAELRQFAHAKRQDKIVLAGTANLAKSTTDFPLTIGPVLEALEEQVVILQLLSSMELHQDQVSVRIGSETSYEPLSEASVIAGQYDSSSGSKIGILGPTRMDYASSMSAVGAVARYVSRFLADN